MPYEDVIDTMRDGTLDETERKNGNICDDSDYSFGEEHEMDYNTYSLSDTLEQNIIYIYIYIYIYIWISGQTNGEKYLVKGNIVVYLS